MSLKFIGQHRILTTAAGILAMLLLVLLLIIFFSEPLVRSLVERQSQDNLGRQLFIEGDLDIRWRWTHTAVHAEQIRLENAPGYPEPEMLTIERLDFTFKPIKLLIGKLEFGDITLEKLNLVLDRKSEDEANWHFPIFSKEKIATETLEPDNRHEFPVMDMLRLKEGKLVFRDAVKGLELELDLDWVIGEGGDDGEGMTSERGFTISGTGKIQEQPFSVEASGDSLETLRDSNHDFPLSFKLVMGRTEILLDGHFQDPIKLTGINANLRIAGDNLADLFYLTAIPLPPTPPYSLQGQLKKEGDTWAYEEFAGRVGNSDLSGNLSYEIGGERGFLRANLVSDLLDSDDLGGFIGLPPSGETASPEQQQAAAEQQASAELIPDVPLQVERLRTTDLDVSLNAKKIRAPALPFQGMDVRFDLQDGLLKLELHKIVLAEGTIDGVIEVNAKEDIPPMRMDINVKQLSLGGFFAETRFAETTEGFFGGKATLAGQGVSLADVLASSNGKLTVIMADGKISLLLVEGADLDIGEALPLFFGKDKSAQIYCGILDFHIDKGVLTSDIFIIDTDDSLIAGDVQLDLNRETVDATVGAKPKDNSPFSIQSPITISGTFKEPSIGIDAKQAGVRALGAIAIGTLLTPLAAIIPFADVGEAEDANCHTLIEMAADE